MNEKLLRCLRLVTHPVGLGLVTAATILLWMPFGLGYYDWAWERPTARLSMAAFALGVPLCGALGCVSALVPRPSTFRLLVAFCALVVGVIGLLAMFHWLRTH
jgi:hypothetical protein